MEKALFIFSGHNQRAVLALCRALSERGVSFYLVASTIDDSIFQTQWSDKVVYTRKNKSVSIELFNEIRNSVDAAIELIYAPTTEFINDFILGNIEQLSAIAIKFPLVSKEIYEHLTSKEQSIQFVHNSCGVSAPKILEWSKALAPCVFKPKSNIVANQSFYPVLCFNQDDVEKNKKELTEENWFAQEFVQGQSMYLCGYLAQNGDYQSYWQLNLMQQPGGKSIVLAKTCQNPGVDEYLFFSGLTKLGYFGLVMMEIIQMDNGELRYIEINPRFWGPLQLGVDAKPEMIDLFLSDLEFEYSYAIDQRHGLKNQEFWYSWLDGSKVGGCKIYEAAKEMSKSELQQKLNENDVMAR